MIQLVGQLIAPRALGWLSSATEPRIHSVYRQSVNLIDPDRGLLSVVLPSLGPGPFAIVAAPTQEPFDGFGVLGTHSPVVIRDRSLQLAEIRIDSSNAAEWPPRPDWVRFGQGLTEALISQLASLLHQHAPPGSFAPLARGTTAEPEHAIQSLALKAAAGPAEQLRTSLADDNLDEVRAAAEGLAGLGGGVTPSGDDYLQGAIHALWSTVDEQRATSTGEAIVNVAELRTNAISSEWLKAAARGEAGGDWHQMIQAMNSDHGIDEATVRLIHRGHTSGADALAGFLAIVSTIL